VDDEADQEVLVRANGDGIGMKAPVLTWHFCNNGVLRDGRDVVASKWMKLRTEDWNAGWGRNAYSMDIKEQTKAIRAKRPVLCCVGFHASRRPRHAFHYATCLDEQSKLVAERVEIRGHITEDHDKLVGTQRRVVAMLSPEDTLEVLLLWACAGALKRLKDPYYKVSAAKDRRNRHRVTQIRKYILGKGRKPRKPSYSVLCNLYDAINEDSPMMYRLEEVEYLGCLTPDGTLEKLLLKKMGIGPRTRKGRK
jgi:hypothetical protein